MNEYNAFAKKSFFGYHAYVRFPKHGSAQVLTKKGGGAEVYECEVTALRAALDHLLKYINGNLVRDGVIMDAIEAAESKFKPEIRGSKGRVKYAGKAGRSRRP